MSKEQAKTLHITIREDDTDSWTVFVADSGGRTWSHDPLRTALVNALHKSATELEDPELRVIAERASKALDE